MNNKITIGIPRGLLYYKYGTLWETFFKRLGVKVLISPNTNYDILKMGEEYIPNDCCLSLKIYIGHVYYLKDKVDYILVPRILSLKKHTRECLYFSSLYDIVNNVFNINILNYVVDINNNKFEEEAFIKMGDILSFTKSESIEAYKFAKREEYKKNKINYLIQSKRINDSVNNILLVSHPYNTYDEFVGKFIIDELDDLNINIIYSDIYNPDNELSLYKNISENLYWTYNQELLNTIELYKKNIKGIIFLLTDLCSYDSLVNYMCKSKLSIPILDIVIDNKISKIDLKDKIENFVKENIYE